MINSEFTIELKGVRFFAFHGVYQEERQAGNEYLVDLSVKYRSGAKGVNKIADTVNYEKLFEILKQEMQQPRDLLETLATSIIEKIREQFPQVKETIISIQKKNPPMTNFSGNVAVTFKKSYPD